MDHAGFDAASTLQIGRELRSRLIARADELSVLIPNFRAVFGNVLAACRDFAICTEPSDAAFSFNRNTGTMTLNARHITMIDRQIAALQASGTRPWLLLDQHLQELRRWGIELLILHEWTHLPQGIGRFEDVQALKATEGPATLAKLDVIADNMASKVFAWLRSIEEGDSTEANYLRHYHNAIVFICAVCSPAFGVSTEKRPKVNRAVGLYFMAARLFLADTAEQTGSISALHSRFSHIPLDAAIIASFSDDYSVMSVVGLEPRLEVIVPGRRIDVGLAKRLIGHISRGEFFDAHTLAIAPLAPALTGEDETVEVTRR